MHKRDTECAGKRPYVDCHGLSLPLHYKQTGKKCRGATGKGAVAQRAHPWGVGQMRFLFLVSYRFPLSAGIISTWMNMDNWPLNCQGNGKHLFNFFILCSDNWYINPKNVPEHSQSVKFPRFFADDNQPYLKVKKERKRPFELKSYSIGLR